MSFEITPFDTSTLPETIRLEIESQTRIIITIGRRVVRDMLEIGERLSRVKSLLPHGMWLPWLIQVGIPERTAQNMMRAYTALKSEKNSDLPLSVSTLYLLAQAPEDIRQEALEMACAGETVTVKSVKEMLANDRAQPSLSGEVTEIMAETDHYLFTEDELRETQQQFALWRSRIDAPDVSIEELIAIRDGAAWYQQNAAERRLRIERGLGQILNAVSRDGVFLDTVLAFRAIRDQRLYRETHATFEAYCRERWDIEGRFVNDTIEIVSAVSK
jgi:hypothetical protein